MRNNQFWFTGLIIALCQKLIKFLERVIVHNYRSINQKTIESINQNFYVTTKTGRYFLHVRDKKFLSKDAMRQYWQINRAGIHDSELQSFIGAFPYADELCNSFLVVFDTTGKVTYLVHDKKNGFQTVGWHEMQVHLFIQREVVLLNNFYFVSKA